MKILLKSVLMVFLLTVGFGAAQAQKKGGHDFDPAKKAEHQTAMMTEKLALTESQAAKVKDINLKYAQKGKAAHDANKAARAANKDGDKAKNKEARQALRTEHTAELRKVFTAEQYKTWEQMKADREAKRGEHGKKGKHGKPDKSKIKRG
ncbi:MAG: DUF4890 domain-containing protein [Saprospiraceae bacterium]|nr:DUF4890 domain-containing protein [Saprospiraceae bacterium]